VTRLAIKTWCGAEQSASRPECSANSPLDSIQQQTSTTSNGGQGDDVRSPAPVRARAEPPFLHD
jgi:hypothetical protein